VGIAELVGRITSFMQTLGFFLIFVGIWRGGGAIIAAIVLMLAPTIRTFLQLALSRSREYDADLGAVQLTGDPAGLASALQALEQKQGKLWESIFIPGGRTPNPSLLRTHPRTEDRIERLLELTGSSDSRLPKFETSVSLPSNYRPAIQYPRYHVSGFWY